VRRRSSAILMTMGIGNIAMGCLALLCGTCGGGSIVIMKQVPDTQDLVAFMNHRIFGWMVWELTKHGVSLLLGMVLILAGVGLIMQKRWGWLLTLCCAPCTLLQQFAYVLFQLLFVVPAANEYQRQISGNFAGSNGQARAVGTIIGILLPQPFTVSMPWRRSSCCCFPRPCATFAPPSRQRSGTWTDGRDRMGTKTTTITSDRGGAGGRARCEALVQLRTERNLN
jgi:hypothetical protein